MIDTLLEDSIINSRKIVIVYAANNIITKRIIKVIAIKDNEIKAYCYLRRQIRTFKIDNILAAEYTSSHRKRKGA